MIFERGELAEFVREGRELVESLMYDSCIVGRDTGQEATDPITGKVSKVFETIYAGKCKMQWGNSQESNPVAAGHVYTNEPGRLDLPQDAAVEAGDVATITDAFDIVTGLSDPSRAGKKVRLVAMNRGTVRSANRWNVELMTG